jgi:3-hydroxybutyryl-CoA dehydratase
MSRLATAIVGTRPTPRMIGPVTQTDIIRFAGAGGDFNPLHHDVEFAAKAGFKAPIAMGQFTAGLLVAWLTDWCGIENLRSIEVRFTAPLSIGDTVELAGEVISLTSVSETESLADLKLTASCRDTNVITGRAAILIRAASE